MRMLTLMAIVTWTLLVQGAPAPAVAAPSAAAPPEPPPLKALEHVVVFHDPALFAAWPANGGMWSFDGGREILVGFISGKFKIQAGHDILPPYANRLARSRDGGRTWQVEDCPSFVPASAKRLEEAPAKLLADPEAIVRLSAIGYHGNEDPAGALYISRDRGKTWAGAFPLSGIERTGDLKGWEITCRTDALRDADGTWLFMLSARPIGVVSSDKVFAARWDAQAQRLVRLGWVTPQDDPFRGAMPATVRCSPTRLVTAVRRRKPREDVNWIDAYRSDDNGATWRHLAKVGDTGNGNGNPPALARLADGRLVCVYGNRATPRLLARASADDGATWGPESILRTTEPNPPGSQKVNFNPSDMGYPRLVQRPDGKLVVIYYWCSPQRPQGHIEATIVDVARDDRPR